MRFVLLTQYYPPEIGAPQTRLAALVEQLCRRGHQVEVVTAMPSYPHGRIEPSYRRSLYRREVTDGAIVHRVWIYAAMGRGLTRLLSYLSFTMMCVLGLVRCRRPDLIFIESPPLFPTVPGVVAGRCWRAHTIMNVADLWPDAAVELGALPQGRTVGAARWLERLCYEKVDMINAATEGLAVAIRGRTRHPDKVVLFPNGVDTTLFNPAKGLSSRLTALGLPTENLFVHAGTMSYIHGLENVIRAFARKPDFTLALIGAGSHRGELVELVRATGAGNIHFVDPLSPRNLADVLPCATGAIVSVRNIPLAQSVRPSKLFPAMAAAVPVLYAGDGEGADLVRAAACGLVVPNDDPDAIVAGLERIARAVEPLGQNGRAWVEANLGWDAIVAEWLGQVEGRLGVSMTTSSG